MHRKRKKSEPINSFNKAYDKTKIGFATIQTIKNKSQDYLFKKNVYSMCVETIIKSMYK